MIQLNTLVEILVGVFVVSGGIVGFFVMQKGQNMKIEQLQKDAERNKIELQREIDDLKHKQSVATSNQIKTEKDLVAIQTKLDHILEAVEDLKTNGHP